MNTVHENPVDEVRHQMRAAYYTEQGSAGSVLQISYQPVPMPGPGEVRVKLHTSGVNPSDWKVRKGGFGRRLSTPLVIPHSDGAGEIDCVGLGVSPNRVGERVWIWNGQWKRAFGTAAEFIALPSDQAVPLPSHISYAIGACLGIPAFTAIHAVRLVHAGPEVTVLIPGGAGAVGRYAIQFAKARGARVITTVSSEAKAQYARVLGADEVINYRTEDVGARVNEATNNRGVDAIIETDLSANANYYPSILRPHAIVAVYGMSSSETNLPTLWLLQNSVTISFMYVYDLSNDDRLNGLVELNELLEQNSLIHTIAHRFPLREIAESHDVVEHAKHIGNVILDI